MSDFPTPHIIQCDDGSLSFEWFGKDCRVALILEKDPSESGWHYVTKFSSGEEGICEELSKMDIKKFIECIYKTKGV